MIKQKAGASPPGGSQRILWEMPPPFRQKITAGQTVYIPSNEFHQLTNIGKAPLKFIYCYGPAGDVDHWKQELKGTLPKAGEDVSPLPEGAQPQCAEPAEEYKDEDK
ncbi:MAG TPA: hypothetical protein VK112_01050 [Fodinibius sp.]|nr:hypothetical protein [Fodinibius sp.]